MTPVARLSQSGRDGPTDYFMVAGNKAKSFEILKKELHLPCYLIKHA